MKSLDFDVADVTIDIYLKNQPVLERLKNPATNKPFSLSLQQGVYHWRPFGTQLPLLRISAPRNPLPYRVQLLCDFEQDLYLDTIIKDAEAEGLSIPTAFLEKLEEENGYLIADIETYNLLNKYPDLKTLIDEPFFWEVARFSEGKPLYHVTLDVYADIKKRGVPFALQFARYLCHTYHGIACDDAETNYGKPFQFKEDARFANHLPHLSQKELEQIRWEWPATAAK